MKRSSFQKNQLPELFFVKDFNSSGYYLIDYRFVQVEILDSLSNVIVWKRWMKKSFDENAEYPFLTFMLNDRKCYINPIGAHKIAAYDIVEDERMFNELSRMYYLGIKSSRSAEEKNITFNGHLPEYSQYTQITFLNKNKNTDAVALINTFHFEPKDKPQFRYRSKLK